MNLPSFNYATVAGSTEMHNQFKKEFTIYVSKMIPQALVLPYDVAFVRAYSEPEKVFQVGQKGVLDTIVILPKATLWFDMKTGGARLQKNQMAFCERIFHIHGERRGFKITSVEDGIDIIEQFL